MSSNICLRHVARVFTQTVNLTSETISLVEITDLGTFAKCMRTVLIETNACSNARNQYARTEAGLLRYLQPVYYNSLSCIHNETKVFLHEIYDRITL